MRFIKQGYGYWDVTKYPYGGNFRRAAENRPIAEVLEQLTVKGRSETKVKLLDGSVAVVRNEYIGEAQ